MANLGPATLVTQQAVAVVTPVSTSNNPVTQGSNALRLLAVAKGVNANALGDTAMQVINATNWSATTVVLSNASISLTTAAAGIFTAVSAGGTAVRTNAALSALTASTVTSAAAATAAAIALNTTAQTIYFNVATAQGAAATLDVYVYGYDLSP